MTSLFGSPKTCDMEPDNPALCSHRVVYGAVTANWYNTGDIVDEILQWDELEIRLTQIFSPAAAIDRKALFHGRHTIIRRLTATANQAGQHAIIYGERGVGKTSIANVLSSYLEPFTSETIATARVNCYGETTYTEIWNSLFEQIDIPSAQKYGELTLNDVFRVLREEDARKLILIIDEFDRIQDPDIDTMFADTIKTLSDFSLDTTLILVGVADDIDDLINRELTAKWPLRANNERSVRATWLHLPNSTKTALGNAVPARHMFRVSRACSQAGRTRTVAWQVVRC